MKDIARVAARVAVLAVVAAEGFSLPARASTTDTAAAASDKRKEPGTVYVIPIKGMIEPALLYVLRRGIAEADASGADALILVMDTPGGTLDAAGEIVRTMQKVRIPTYTFVEKDAFSAGAIIALSTDHIYMAPGSVIGDAMPIMMTPMGGVQEMPEDIQEKSVSAVAALIRAAAQESGHDPKLAEAMVRREVGYKIGDEVICPEGQLLTLTNVEAERFVGPEGEKKPLLSKGTVGDLQAMLEAIGHGGATVRELQVTSAEKVARFIAALAPLFLMAGLLGIYIEFKTPGFGLPGILGILSLALFFWGHHIAGLAGMEEVLVFLVGLILVGVEIFLLPGIGLIGITGALMMLWALLSAMIHQMPGGPWIPTLPQLRIPLLKLSGGIVMAAAMAAALGRFLPKSSVFSHLVLNQSTSRAAGYTASPLGADLVGREGSTLSTLRPSGRALFGDQPMDVMTRGEFVESGARVRIAEATSNRIVVERVEPPSNA
jgi:membrane-bound serine protease (ClpP class)